MQKIPRLLKPIKQDYLHFKTFILWFIFYFTNLEVYRLSHKKKKKKKNLKIEPWQKGQSLKSRGSCSKLNFQNCRLIICFMGEKIRESWALSTTPASMCPKLSANRDSSNRNPIINSYASVIRLIFSQLYFTPFPNQTIRVTFIFSHQRIWFAIRATFISSHQRIWFALLKLYHF